MGFCGSKEDAMSVKKGVLLNTCFVDVLNMIPHALLALICIFILTVWNHSVMGKIKVKTWVHFPGHNLRWISTLALIIVNIVQIAEGVISDSNDPDTVNYHTFIPQCVTTVGTIVSITYYHNVEMWNSPKFLLVLIVYWPSAIILKVLKAFSLYKNNLTLDYLKPWLLWMAITAYLIIFIVELNLLRVQRYYFFKRPRLQQPPEDLEHTRYAHSYVNFLSKAVFWWVTDLMVEGYKHPLQFEDLGRVPESEQAQTQFKKLQFAFEEEKFKATQKGCQPSLFKTYLQAFWPMLLLAALYRFLGDSLSFVGPVIIQYIVDYAYDITDPEYHSRNRTAIHYVKVDQFVWNGYVLAVVLFLATVLQHTLLQNHNYLVYREGIRLRTAIQTLVYDKALRLSSMVLSQGKMTIGQIMNHMIVDSMFLMHMFFFIHYIWAIPFQVFVTIILLYFRMGWSAVIGGMFVVLCGPLIYIVGVIMSRLQKKLLVQSDGRVKNVNELMQGIKSIKLLAWEDVFTRRVTESRQKELHHLFPLLVIRALIGFLGMAAPAVGAILTFILYPYMETEPLTAGRTFSTLALFNMLSTPLQLLTIFAASFANAKVSGARLVPYLLSQEVEGAHITGNNKTKTHNVGIDTAEEEAKQDSMVQYDAQTGLPLTTLTKDEAFCSSQSSLGSHISHTPGHSRQNSGASLMDIFDNKRLSLTHNSSSDYLDVKPLALVRKTSSPLIGSHAENTADRRRKRNHSGFSTEDEDDIADECLLIELRTVLEISQANFSWELENRTALSLKNISLKIPTGKLTMIVGPVGSGKSSLISAMLGEMVTTSGIVEWSRDTGISYAAQRAWLLNASVRDNILFGNPFIWRRYKKVLSACALQQDMDTLVAGDLTEVGEKGVTLSGGQKQRVCLARAIYSDADAVILDDPFSALDAHVGRHVFEEAIQRRLLRRKRSVILVTHQLQYIGQASQVIVMKEGEIVYQGRPGDVKKYDQDLYDSWKKALKDAKPADLKLSKESDLEGDRRQSLTERPPSVQSNLSLAVFSRQISRSQMSVMTEASNEDRNDEFDGEKTKQEEMQEESGKLIKKEHKEEGVVMGLVYMYYFRACCMALCVVTLLLQLLHHSLMVSANFSLSIWSSQANRFQQNLTHHPPPPNSTVPVFDSTPHVKLYAALSLSAVAGAMLASLILYFTGLQGARTLFKNMLSNVIQVNMRFFDTNPSGRVLNRFTSDVAAVDQKLAASFESSLRCLLYTFSAIVVNSIATPFFLLAALPLVLLYYFLQRFFRNTSRELQRLDSVTKSPVYAHFGETLGGLQTIRAYRCQVAFRRKAFAIIDSNVAPFLYIHTINRWLGIRLDYLGCLLVFLAAIASLSAGALGSTNPAFIGLCIMYALMISALLNWLVRMTAEVEMNMNAVERIREYTLLTSEFQKHKDGNIQVSESWPEQGAVEFDEVSLRYDSHLDDVVSDVTFSIKAGEKIGICGRTGSGKTSLSLALFRMLELSSGEITIDGHNIARVDLAVLRSRLSIIPQDPVLFNGSVRFNLDPSGVKSDESLWAALDTVHLRETVAGLPGTLEAQVSEGGDNFSMGQRQLLCLARAFLRDSRVIILDEATASIDVDTDAKLQEIVHEDGFKDKTILTIAHRMATIACYDRVMVLDQGRLVEFDKPDVLKKQEDSFYASLVNQTNK
ncbi:ATP-binding cassette sub-family C member 9-like [Haliotis rubra]|uniref:ATP-binding cassette sub-family C member 9-like n=1 Tax=Haliotis rubra TaxID=36100 RepID=UPI001EE60E45|nr:ATP-binding cassette sub-family C member 9-like [Haliotis rubra]